MTPRPILYPAFGAELRRVMALHDWTVDALAQHLGCSQSHLSDARTGKMMPNEHRTAALAELLFAPRLVVIREADATTDCDECGLSFVRSAHWVRRARFCSRRCRVRWWSRTTNAERSEQREATAPHTILSLKRQLRELVTDLEATRGELATYKGAVAAFCRGCEPDGICHDPASPLRPVSPLPLAKEEG